jgi:hypothetical protein
MLEIKVDISTLVIDIVIEKDKHHDELQAGL